jgi:mRNA interferase MazF
MARIAESTNIADALDTTAYDDRIIKRGEIYYVDLEDTAYGTRYLQTKTRPALIIQNDIGNDRSATVIVALITSKFKKPYPFQYRFTLDGRESVLLGEQLMTLDKFRVLEKFGELSYQQMQEAEKAIMYSLQLNRLSLENVQDINVTSMITEKTRTQTTIYFTIIINFTNNQYKEIKVSLNKLQTYDSTITQNIDFDELKKKLDCCRGLNWLTNNNEI